MCTKPSLNISTLGINQNDYIENDDNSYFENASDKEKEESYFKELDSDSNDTIIAKSKDGQFGKVFNNYLFSI